MKITLLSDANSWKNSAITGLAERLEDLRHDVRWVHSISDITAGELMFILGFFKIIPADTLRLHRHNLVVHESAVPKGRGWSPLTWQILEGKRTIPLTLFEAVEKVDAGPIYLEGRVKLAGNELLPEVQTKAARELVRLCEAFVKRYPAILNQAREQKGRPTFYRRRTPADSELDIHKSLKSQVNLLRVVDNEDYPAFFRYLGRTYRLRIDSKKD